MGSNQQNENSSMSTIPLSISELVENLFEIIQNILVGTATLSRKLSSDTCLEWKIDLASKSFVSHLKYELKCDEHEKVSSPVTDSEEMVENSGTVDDTVTMDSKSMRTFDVKSENSYAFCNVKQEIPELLLVLNNNEEVKGKIIRDQTAFTYSETNMPTESTSHSMNNFNVCISSSIGSKAISVSSYDLNGETIESEEEENGNCDDERLEKRPEGIGINTNEGKGCKRKDVKQQHRIIHTRGKLYNCDICDESFTSSCKLTKHKVIHLKVKLLNCEVCNKSFTYPQSLRVHTRIHTGEKPYKCDKCGKSFAQSGHLISHKRIHTGEKPYKCEICFKSFSESRSMKQHKKIHTGEKPYKCEKCGKSFAQPNSFTYHKRTHTGEKPYKCEICFKSFNVAQTLKHHVKIHSGEKPYKCEECGKSFARSSSLTSHKRIHTGEKLFDCKICNKSFAQLSGLRYHKRIHMAE